MLPSHLIIRYPITLFKQCMVGYFFAFVKFTFGDGMMPKVYKKEDPPECATEVSLEGVLSLVK